eukprot:gnl/Dysnectes_brevis/14533_a34553_45.p2 GENE.gnl/Dysnectes_brevis/14533_a34553_45~~gnl/Dysnectes_brevis/14533_a34553_45.p2  ORF type:complete len:175 (+),score=82.70 gnl/Dysnectes_brevis/14533_a34553_45:3-527(+)
MVEPKAMLTVVRDSLQRHEGAAGYWSGLSNLTMALLHLIYEEEEQAARVARRAFSQLRRFCRSKRHDLMADPDRIRDAEHLWREAETMLVTLRAFESHLVGSLGSIEGSISEIDVAQQPAFAPSPESSGLPDSESSTPRHVRAMEDRLDVRDLELVPPSPAGPEDFTLRFSEFF